jgi:hypothetical protein
VKLKGTAVPGYDLDKKTGALKPKPQYSSVSQKIAAGKSKKVRVKRRGA